MNNRSIKSHNIEEQIGLKELFSVLNKSRQTIMMSCLFFSFIALIYSIQVKPLYKSSAIIEIGYSQDHFGKKIFYESSSELVENIRVEFIYKNPITDTNSDFSILAIGNQFFRFEASSNSIETSKKIIQKIIDYSKKRHMKISESISNHNDYQINLLNEQIKLVENFKVNLKNKIGTNDTLDYKSKLSEELLSLTALETDLLMSKQNLESQVATQTQGIKNGKTKVIKKNPVLITFIGLLIGLTLSILLVLVRYFYDNFQEPNSK